MALSTIKTASIANDAITSDKIINDGNLGVRNLIINGAMQVWQRGTSQSSNNYSSVDRWTFYAGSGMSVSQSTDVPSEFKYSCSFGGTGNSSGLTTRLEGQDCARLVGKDITVSFYLKQTTGAGSGAIVVALLYADTLDNFGGTTYIGQPTVDTTSDWVRYEVTFTNLPAQAANGLALNFKTPSSSAVVFLITGVQLEVGDTATPFEHRSYGDELFACQRYYQRTQSFMGAGHSVHGVVGISHLHRAMRATPTLSQDGVFVITDGYSIDATQSSTGTQITGNNINTTGYYLYIKNISGLTAGKPYMSRLSNANGLLFDAEL